MARRKKRTVRSRARTYFKKARRKARRGTRMDKLIQFDSMIYGASRAKVSNAIAPLTSKIPILGNLSDEAGMVFLNYMVAKNTGGMLRNIALKGLVIENARAGEAIGGGFTMQGGPAALSW